MVIFRKSLIISSFLMDLEQWEYPKAEIKDIMVILYPFSFSGRIGFCFLPLSSHTSEVANDFWQYSYMVPFVLGEHGKVFVSGGLRVKSDRNPSQTSTGKHSPISGLFFAWVRIEIMNQQNTALDISGCRLWVLVALSLVLLQFLVLGSWWLLALLVTSSAVEACSPVGHLQLFL